LKKYCVKEFLTDSPELSTSSVVSFYGDVKWHKGDKEPLRFLEISSCHEKARLHCTYEMSNSDWLMQVKRLREHIDKYIKFLESVGEV